MATKTYKISKKIDIKKQEWEIIIKLIKKDISNGDVLHELKIETRKIENNLCTLSFYNGGIFYLCENDVSLAMLYGGDRKQIEKKILFAIIDKLICKDVFEEGNAINTMLNEINQ